MEEEECRWYALFVKSRHEKSVDMALRQRRYESFLPLYRVRHKWADRYKTVELPLFPGYVFCRVAPTVITPVASLPGIVDVVRSGPFPATIPEPEMNALQRVERSRLGVEPWPELIRGQRVVVTDGPLSGMLGCLVEVKSAWRLVISVSLLQRSVLVEVERDWVAPLRSPEPDGLDSLRAMGRCAGA